MEFRLQYQGEYITDYLSPRETYETAMEILLRMSIRRIDKIRIYASYTSPRWPYYDQIFFTNNLGTDKIVFGFFYENHTYKEIQNADHFERLAQFIEQNWAL